VSKPPAAFAPGFVIAPGYEIIAHISRGRALDVYDVWSEERQCRCVVKTVRPDRWGDRGVRRRLEVEGRLLRRLSHPHIVRAYERPATTNPVVVMETLSGETLAHLIEEGEALSASEIAHLGLQLCSAVQYLHRKQILHLDLKPANIIAEAGRAKIIDLSVARRPGPARPGVGTWCYMAPEQVWGGELGTRADVWGIGVVLWEAAAGKAAFGGDEDDPPSSGAEELPPDRHPQVLRPAEPIAKHRSLPTELASAIDAALAPNARERPSAAVLADLLERVPDVVSPRATRGT
jgi:eukaryotic-like serine/threonine-protein kinase